MRTALNRRRAIGMVAAALLLCTVTDARAAGADGTTTPDQAAPDQADQSAPAGQGAPLAPAADQGAPADRAASPDAGEGEPRPRANALSVTATVLPGLLVHGSGHLAGGDPKTGYRLLAIEGAGLGLLAAGFIPIVLTGTSRRIIGTAAALSVLGVGLFAISFLADVYGIAAPAGGFGSPPIYTPIVQTALGYRYVYDPVFSYRQFLVQDIDFRTGPWRLHPSAWFALDDTNARLRAHVAYRITGPMPRTRPASRDGSFLDVDLALTRHAFTSNRFATTTGEVAVAGRLDMVRIGPSLRGSFAEMSVGIALQTYAYDTNARKADVGELLLARFGYGMYIGRPGRTRGEVTLYYNHRHDDFAAGLKSAGLASGVPGHFGVAAHLYVSDHWGLAAEGAVGSAYVTGLSVLFRHGDSL